MPVSSAHAKNDRTAAVRRARVDRASPRSLACPCHSRSSSRSAVGRRLHTGQERRLRQVSKVGTICPRRRGREAAHGAQVIVSNASDASCQSTTPSMRSSPLRSRGGAPPATVLPHDEPLEFEQAELRLDLRRGQSRPCARSRRSIGAPGTRRVEHAVLRVGHNTDVLGMGIPSARSSPLLLRRPRQPALDTCLLG